jgi:hypothetical protein
MEIALSLGGGQGVSQGTSRIRSHGDDVSGCPAQLASGIGVVFVRAETSGV